MAMQAHEIEALIKQLVYKALKGKMDGPAGDLHALALTTKAPE